MNTEERYPKQHMHDYHQLRIWAKARRVVIWYPSRKIERLVWVSGEGVYAECIKTGEGHKIHATNKINTTKRNTFCCQRVRRDTEDLVRVGDVL